MIWEHSFTPIVLLYFCPINLINENKEATNAKLFPYLAFDTEFVCSYAKSHLWFHMTIVTFFSLIYSFSFDRSVTRPHLEWTLIEFNLLQVRKQISTSNFSVFSKTNSFMLIPHRIAIFWSRSVVEKSVLLCYILTLK